MSASVAASGGGAFTLTLTDSTQGWNQATTQTSDTAQLGSAEVIAEAPSSGSVLPLSDFGTVSFADVTADHAAIGTQNPSALTMVSAGDVTEATPSALTGGNAFSVTSDNRHQRQAGAGADRHRDAARDGPPGRAGTATITGPAADRGERTRGTALGRPARLAAATATVAATALTMFMSRSYSGQRRLGRLPGRPQMAKPGRPCAY